MRYDRAQQRGKPLLPMCQKAKRTKHEFGKNDKRIFCYGLFDMMTDEMLQECANCKAHWTKAEPL